MKYSKTTIISLTSLIVVFLIFVIFILLPKKDSNILKDNLFIGTVDISNNTPEEALDKVYQLCKDLENKGLNLQYQDQKINMPSLTTSFDADLAYLLFHCDQDALNSLLVEHKQSMGLTRLWEKFIQQKIKRIEIPFYLDETRIKMFITSNFQNLEKEALDARFVFQDKKIEILSEEYGQTINWDKTLQDIRYSLNLVSEQPVNIHTDIKNPLIYSQDLQGLEESAKQLSGQTLSLKFENKLWPVTQADIATWLDVKKENEELILYFNTDRVANYLEIELSPKINLEPKSHRFEIKDGRINNWQPGQDGYQLDTKNSAKKIITSYNLASSTEIELIVDTIPPAEADSLNIKDIIGTGHSNFAGSPANRRHNIDTGVAALHGLIIKDGEEFSLVKALGTIDESTGYLPELVIKGDKTIPEYGGGLCQVATTLFRASLASGLPITARQNHSYRVSYYEPAGTDASIYDPWPDVRFINDTGNDILIQAKVEKDDVYFDFWGVKDGRKIKISEPVIYNIVAPPPTKIIESEDLAPGEKKCTERAHAGASAYFDYTVIYPEINEETGENIEKYRRFNSYYVPWQEVCLVGKEKEIEPNSEEEIIDDNTNNQTEDVNKQGEENISPNTTIE